MDGLEELKNQREMASQATAANEEAQQRQLSRADTIESLWREAGFEIQNFTGQPPCLFRSNALDADEKKKFITGMLAVGDYLNEQINVSEVEDLIAEYLQIVNGSDPARVFACSIIKAILCRSEDELANIVDNVVGLNSGIEFRNPHTKALPDLRDVFGLSVERLINRSRATLVEVKQAAFEAWRNARPNGWETVAEKDSTFDLSRAKQMCEANANYWINAPIDLEPVFRAIGATLSAIEDGEPVLHDVDRDNKLSLFLQMVLDSLKHDDASLTGSVDRVLKFNNDLPVMQRIFQTILDVTWKVGLRRDRHPESSIESSFDSIKVLERFRFGFAPASPALPEHETSDGSKEAETPKLLDDGSTDADVPFPFDPEGRESQIIQAMYENGINSAETRKTQTEIVQLAISPNSISNDHRRPFTNLLKSGFLAKGENGRGYFLTEEGENTGGKLKG